MNTPLPRRGLLLAAAAAPVLPGRLATAQPAWPAQPIRMIVPFAAGVTDSIGRLVGTEMQRALGQPIVVENRPGAGGAIGAEACARAPADGHTICMGTISTHAINPAIMPRIPYDNLRDFAPVTQLTEQPNAIVVHPAFPARDLAGFVVAVREAREPHPYATSGVGTSTHLAGALFALLAGGQLEHVPFRGSGEVMTAVISGQVPIAFDNLSSVVPFVREGRVRLIGVGSRARLPDFPDAPAIAEALPGFVSVSWHGLFAPAATPAPILARLHREAVAALRQPAVAQRLADLGVTPVGSNPEEFRAFIAAETERWRDVARRADLRLT
ncbi:MAG: tripartite tricarboxylate transporter substrate-binding protein [Acetobacteraceae bacterium]|nr:tripartite tricarboxylate transporter substrate-binding protein [Acetobacteraceae bacterium]MDW8398611.1 tripartite tricarboxylate transporter substrate-binding protein [Acetobacteraceae bacterium]